MIIKNILMLLMLIAIVAFLFDDPRGYSFRDLATVQASMGGKEIAIQRELLLNQADVIDVNWLHSLNALVKNVQGRIVWSSSLQFGVISFSGLPKTNSTQSYQLWVYDLEGELGKPILLSHFKKGEGELLSFRVKPKARLELPYKFELLLDDDSTLDKYPLLLAQP